jgi:hypothetical protein
MKKKSSENKRVYFEELKDAPLQYAPNNELGVVFLFSYLLKHFGFSKIQRIQAGFPDCLAWQKTDKGEKLVRIEFEYRSSSFLRHRHPKNKCDLVVCWKDDWHKKPENLQIIELREFFRKGFNVWIAPVGGQYKEEITKSRTFRWSVPRNSHRGDLILFYHNYPQSFIQEIFTLTSSPYLEKVTYKKGMDFMADIKKICSLNSPVALHDLRNHKNIRTAAFIKNKIRGRQSATAYWPDLHKLILNKNPSLRIYLKRFSPDMM